MAEFTYIPDFGASKNKKPKVNAIKFRNNWMNQISKSKNEK